MNKTVRLVLLALLLLIAGFDIGLLLGPSLAPARPVKKSSVTTLPAGLLSTIADVRQSTAYSCGAAALQAVLNYYGIDKREKALMDMLKTTEEAGTSPDNIVRVAKELGLQADPRENVRYEDLIKAYREGIPVICAIQAWTDALPGKRAWTSDWEDGHYVIVIGADEQFVYVEDPSLLGTRGIILKQEFLDRWHDYTGGPPFDPTDRAYVRLGIFMTGKTPVRQYSFTKVD
ncbi:MAG TPA: cysteine peptidase family C39 domain-containing protein [Acidobacteriota bacterium]|nr:cysteine peptidase family C39 domain-containing protein [Acidobacteriota bacterium]